ncbi:hypothetical protein [Paenibacillus violae]|nr:hypothetical protein [Paenibacillus sp. PFR10]
MAYSSYTWRWNLYMGTRFVQLTMNDSSITITAASTRLAAVVR